MLELRHVITHEEWGRGLGRVVEGGTKAEMNTFDEYNPAIYFRQKSKAIKNVKTLYAVSNIIPSSVWLDFTNNQ